MGKWGYVRKGEELNEEREGVDSGSSLLIGTDGGDSNQGVMEINCYMQPRPQ